MKALVLRGEWAPRRGYPVTEAEINSRKARVASQVWRHPTLALEQRADPSPAPDEVLIRVRACGVCGSDTHCIETDDEGYLLFSGPTRLPEVIGHEYAGEVVALGEAVTTLRVGEAVAAEGMLWCGLCPSCRSGHPNQCAQLEMVGFSAPGAYADLIATRERYCWSLEPLRDSMGEDELYELGGLLEPAGCSFNGLYVAAGGFLPGATCAIHGGGAIGLGAIPVAKAGGASRIWLFDPIPERVALALRMGADEAFCLADLESAGTSVHEVILDRTGGAGADVHVEAAGAAQHTFPEIERCLAPTGKVVYLGRTGEHARLEADIFVTGANALIGSRGHAGGGVYPALIRLAAAGRLPLREMITARYPFAQVLDALERSKTREDGKIMVTYG